MKRHLLYFVCPFSDNDEWKRNLSSLNKYWDAFTGRKIVLVASGDGLDSFEHVTQSFKDQDVQFFEVSNDPSLGEVPHFIFGMRNLSDLKDGIIFYAHTKGVYRISQNPSFKRSIRTWREKMYHHCLSDPCFIDEVMLSYKCAGCFLVKGHPNPTIEEKDCWFYSGTFFWLSTSIFDIPQWDAIQKGRCGVETYLRLHFSCEDAYCLRPLPCPGKSLYHVTRKDWEVADCRFASSSSISFL